MSYAFRCEICDLPDALPDWRIERRDRATSWACSPHLAAVCFGLQRSETELIVTESLLLNA